MHSYIKEHLEEYLAGDLSLPRRTEFEALLEKDSKARELVESFSGGADLFEAIRVDEDELLSPDPSFYARVSREIEEENETPFWLVFFQPRMIRQLAFASLMWLLMLGSVAVMTDDRSSETTQLADMVLREQTPDQYYVRLGPNLEQNRDSMLTAMVVSYEQETTD